jgi:PAS domain S-box-containing protein
MTLSPDNLQLSDRFRMILDDIDEGYYEVDLNGRFTFVNRAMVRLIGLPREQILGLTNRDYMDPASAKSAFEIFNEVYRTGRPSRIDSLQVHLKDGSTLWTGFSVSLVRDKDGRPTGFWGLIHDLTSIKQTETDLLRINGQFQSLIQAIPDIVYLKDAEGRNQIVNKAFEAGFGLTQNQIAGKTDEELLPPDLAAACRASDEIVARTGRPYRFEEQSTGPDGREIHFETIKAPIFDEEGRFSGVIGVSRDISERKKAENELRTSEARYQRLFDNSLDGVYQNTLDGRVLSANPACLRMFGFDSEDEYKSVPIQDLYADPKDRKEFLKEMEQDGEVRHRELHLRRKDGSTFYALANARTVRNNGGNIVFEGILTDITSQKANEATLAAALVEKEVLLREIHHRVKNNMQIVSSLLSLQSRFLKHPDDVEIFKESQRRIRSMAYIHEKLYRSNNLARIEFGDYLKSLTQNLVAAQQKSPGRIDLRLDLEEVFLDIQTAIPCGLIVNELVMNSLKHGFPGDRSGEIRIGLRIAEDGEIRLVVGDDGIGLPLGLDVLAVDSMGMQLITLLIGQIEGRLEIDRTRGVEFLLTFKELKFKPRI